MSHPTFRDAVLPPRMDRRYGCVGLSSDGASATQRIDDFGGCLDHAAYDAIIGTSQQVKTCDNGNCGNRKHRVHGGMDGSDVKRLLKEHGRKQVDLAAFLDMAPNKLSKSLASKPGQKPRRFTAAEVDKIRVFFEITIPQDESPIRAIPLVGMVPGGNWKEAIANPVGSIPCPDPSIPPRAKALTVIGDSMDLYVDDGGTIIFDPDDRALYPNKFYIIINEDGETTFKKFMTDPARLVPCSSNPAHTDIIVGVQQFQVFARIIWRAARM